MQRETWFFVFQRNAKEDANCTFAAPPAVGRTKKRRRAARTPRRWRDFVAASNSAKRLLVRLSLAAFQLGLSGSNANSEEPYYSRRLAVRNQNKVFIYSMVRVCIYGDWLPASRRRLQPPRPNIPRLPLRSPSLGGEGRGEGGRTSISLWFFSRPSAQNPATDAALPPAMPQKLHSKLSRLPFSTGGSKSAVQGCLLGR